MRNPWKITYDIIEGERKRKRKRKNTCHTKNRKENIYSMITERKNPYDSKGKYQSTEEDMYSSRR